MKKLILFSSVLISCCFAMDTDTWDGKKYDENSNKQFALAIKHIQLIKDEIQEDWNILDVGCGSGRVAHWLAENQVPKGSVTGIDKSKSMIETAQGKPTIANLYFAHCSAEELSENERFDLVTCFAVMHWIKDQKAVIQNIANILKPNGIFISSWIEKKPMPQLRALFEVSASEKWKDSVSPMSKPLIYPQNRETLTCMVTECGLKPVIKNTEDQVTFSHEKFTKFAETLIFSTPQFNSFPKESRDEFIEDFINKYLEYVPKQDGKINYCVPALLLIARKSK